MIRYPLGLKRIILACRTFSSKSKWRHRYGVRMWIGSKQCLWNAPKLDTKFTSIIKFYLPFEILKVSYIESSNKRSRLRLFQHLGYSWRTESLLGAPNLSMFKLNLGQLTNLISKNTAMVIIAHSNVLVAHSNYYGNCFYCPQLAMLKVSGIEPHDPLLYRSQSNDHPFKLG